MIKNIVLYGILMPVVAVWLFLKLVPTQTAVFGRSRYAHVPPELAAANDRFFAIADTVRSLDDAYARIHSRALASRAAAGTLRAATITGKSGTKVHAETGIPLATSQMMLGIVEEELAGLGLERPAVPVSVITVIDSGLFFPRYRRAVAIPDREGAPCTVVMMLSFRFTQFNGTAGSDRLLGTCGFYAVYGMPGEGPRRWLAETKLQRAAYLQSPASHGTRPRMDAAQVNILGSNTVVIACRAGRAESCDALFDATPSSLPPVFPRPMLSVASLPDDVLMSGPTTFAFQSSMVTSGLLAAIATQLGPERFTELWRGDRSVRETFTRLDGRPLGVMISSLVNERMPEYRAGPSVRMSGLLTAALLFVGLLLLVLGRSRRELS